MLICELHLTNKEQLLSIHERYKKDILGRMAGLVLRRNAYSDPYYVSFFGCFNLDRKWVSLFFQDVPYLGKMCSFWNGILL